MPAGDQKHWHDGGPLKDGGASLDGQKYWYDGLPLSEELGNALTQTALLESNDEVFSAAFVADQISQDALLESDDAFFVAALAPEGEAPIVQAALLESDDALYVGKLIASIVQPGLLESDDALYVAEFGAGIRQQRLLESDDTFFPATVIGEADFTLLIAGVVRTDILRVDTLNVSDEYGGRASATFTLECGSSRYRPIPGQEVRFYHLDDCLFGGFIESTEETFVKSTHHMRIDVKCVDYRDIAARRVFAKVYKQNSYDIRTIVEELWRATLRDEGVTLDMQETSVLTTDTPSRIAFEDETVDACLDRVCGIFGFQWQMSPEKSLRVWRARLEVAPYTVYDESGWESMKVTRSEAAYRNRQGIRTSVPTAGVRTSTLVGNGGFDYTLNYGITGQPVITVDGDLKAVVPFAQRGMLDWDFAWDLNSNALLHNPDKPAYTSSNEITVKAPSATLDVYWLENSAAITSRAAVLGGTGIVEAASKARNIRDIETADSLAASYLERFSAGRITIDLETKQVGWKVGQLVSVRCHEPLAAGSFVLQSLSFTLRAGSREGREGFLNYTLKLGSHELPKVLGVTLDGTEITVETEFPHGFEPGDYGNVWGLGGDGDPVDGTWPIIDIPDDTHWTFDPGATAWTPTEYDGYGSSWNGLGELPYNRTDPGEPDPSPGIVIDDVSFNTTVIEGRDGFQFTGLYTTVEPHGLVVGDFIAIGGINGGHEMGEGRRKLNTSYARVETVPNPDEFTTNETFPYLSFDPFQDILSGRVWKVDELKIPVISQTPSNPVLVMTATGLDPETNLIRDKATFVLSTSQQLTTGTNVTTPWIAQADISVMSSISAAINTPPVGGPVSIDILKNGVPVLDAPLLVPEGTTPSDVVRVSNFVETPMVVQRDDVLTMNINSVGSEFAGCDASVVVEMRG